MNTCRASDVQTCWFYKDHFFSFYVFPSTPFFFRVSVFPRSEWDEMFKTEFSSNGSRGGGGRESIKRQLSISTTKIRKQNRRDRSRAPFTARSKSYKPAGRSTEFIRLVSGTNTADRRSSDRLEPIGTQVLRRKPL